MVPQIWFATQKALHVIGQSSSDMAGVLPDPCVGAVVPLAEGSCWASLPRHWVPTHRALGTLHYIPIASVPNRLDIPRGIPSCKFFACVVQTPVLVGGGGAVALSARSPGRLLLTRASHSPHVDRLLVPIPVCPASESAAGSPAHPPVERGGSVGGVRSCPCPHVLQCLGACRWCSKWRRTADTRSRRASSG